MAGRHAYFTPALFEFLYELRVNNNRDWFLENKQRYVSEVRDPALRFIGDVGPALQRISPHVLADPRPVGGSLFRINRDIRFSADKSPYKTAVGMSFGHDRGGHGAAPGYYLHLAPGESFGGGGMYHPDRESLTMIRDAIVGDPQEWRAVVEDPGFAPAFAPMGDVLKRAPQGYDPKHPFIEHLKRKNFVWHLPLADAEVCGPELMERFVTLCRVASPFHRFVANAVGAAW
jgi:uncharacterized protein (TIGR02453 family)